MVARSTTQTALRIGALALLWVGLSGKIDVVHLGFGGISVALTLWMTRDLRVADTLTQRRRPVGRVRLGPALRYAVDLGDPDHALFGLAGGQSGHPGSPYYTDGLTDWLAGRPRPLWMHASDVSYHQNGTWKLHPAQP